MKEIVHHFFEKAGIQPGGSNPWDIQIHNRNFYKRVVKEHSLGLGESYMEGWWDAPRIDQFMERLLSVNVDEDLALPWKFRLRAALHRIINFQTKKRATMVAEKHYNLGNEFYQKMLDPTMNYSCGYWKKASHLEEAQLHKMELICQKLKLSPGMRLLDIGCGWGALAQYAAQNHGVRVLAKATLGEIPFVRQTLPKFAGRHPPARLSHTSSQRDVRPHRFRRHV